MIQGDERATLVAVVDHAWAGEGELSPRPWAPEARAFATLSAALAALDVDVVSVATPNGSHVDLACEAVAAGCHVVVEKPMGLNVASVERLRRDAEAKGVRVFGDAKPVCTSRPMAQANP